MAKNPSTKGTEEVKPSEAEQVDPNMQGLDEWNENEGEIISFKTLSFKPKEVGAGAVLRGFPVAIRPMVSIHDGEKHEGHGMIVKTTRPARLTGNDGVTKVYPAGTEAMIYCTDELLDLMPYAEQTKVVEMSIRVLPRIRTNGGNTFQPLTFKLENDSKGFDRGEVARISINPALRKIGLAVGMNLAGELTNGTQANPVLPQ